MPKLNLGCGNDIREGYINLDCMKLKGVDVVHDLEVYPYPFKDNTFDYIWAEYIIEHLDNFDKILKELSRILKPKGKLVVKVPYDISYSTWSNYQHKRGFNLKTFTPFAKNTQHLAGQSYGVIYFSELKQKLWFPKGKHLESYLIEPIFNRIPTIYESTMLRTLFPAYSIIVELTK